MNTNPSISISTNTNQSEYTLIRGIVIALILVLILLLGGLLSYFAAFPLAQFTSNCTACPFTMSDCNKRVSGTFVTDFCETSLDRCVKCRRN